MRYHDAKDWLTARRIHDLVQSEGPVLQEHVKQKSDYRTHKHHQQRTDFLPGSPTYRVYTSISTERIMQAVERQKRITEQLENIRAQQRTRIARLGIFTPGFAAISYFSIGIISLSLLALLIFNAGTVVSILESFGGVIDTLVALGQYLQSVLALVLHEDWLLSAIALALVIMMGMWLRLMRHPQEA